MQASERPLRITSVYQESARGRTPEHRSESGKNRGRGAKDQTPRRLL